MCLRSGKEIAARLTCVKGQVLEVSGAGQYLRRETDKRRIIKTNTWQMYETREWHQEGLPNKPLRKNRCKETLRV